MQSKACGRRTCISFIAVITCELRWTSVAEASSREEAAENVAREVGHRTAAVLLPPRTSAMGISQTAQTDRQKVLQAVPRTADLTLAIIQTRLQAVKILPVVRLLPPHLLVSTASPPSSARTLASVAGLLSSDYLHISITAVSYIDSLPGSGQTILMMTRTAE